MSLSYLVKVSLLVLSSSKCAELREKQLRCARTSTTALPLLQPKSAKPMVSSILPLMPATTVSNKSILDDEGIGEEPERVTRKSAAKGKGKKASKDAASKAEEENVVAKEEDSE